MCDAATPVAEEICEEAGAVSVNVDTLAARVSIADLSYRYAAALDARDWTLLEQVFANDAVYSIGAYGEFVGVPAIAEKLSELLGGYDSTQHLIGNPISDVDGGRARSTCYVRAYHQWTDQEGCRHTMELGGVYRDELVNGPQGWRITHRVLDVLWREGVANLSSAAKGGEETRVSDPR